MLSSIDLEHRKIQEEIIERMKKSELVSLSTSRFDINLDSIAKKLFND